MQNYSSPEFRKQDTSILNDSHSSSPIEMHQGSNDQNQKEEQNRAKKVAERELSEEKVLQRQDSSAAFDELLNEVEQSKPLAREDSFSRDMAVAESGSRGPVAYPEGFTAEDDLNDDGVIDQLEQQLKVATLKEEVFARMDEHVRREYLRSMRREVDFHHKVAFRFEKAYRLCKRHPEKVEAVNKEILALVQEQAPFLKLDPSILFYGLFFCVYFSNEPVFSFLADLSRKVVPLALSPKQFSGVQYILERAELNGIERLRTSGDSANLQLYHYVLYSAFDDKLRVVYAKILRKLKIVQLRDQDGAALLLAKDYELVKEVFSKNTLKIEVPGRREGPYLCQSYRRYNPAYFEEVILGEQVDKRTAGCFRDRFTVDQEAVYEVLEMYAKKDYLQHFLRVDIARLSQGHIVELFRLCVRHDSFKIALELYLNYMAATDIGSGMVDVLIDSLSNSPKFHEAKLFFLLSHFDVLGVEQLNRLVDVLQHSYCRPSQRTHPMAHQYNTIKVSLLVYRVSWLIERKRIYSLITKCQVLNHYILSSLAKYLDAFQDVQQLHKFMREPVLDLAEAHDSLDLILEMDLEPILNHPVVVEVLNLVYEGQFSINTSVVGMSQTLQAVFSSAAFDDHSISRRLLKNVRSFGVGDSSKQSSLQFHIWKDCLEQRHVQEVYLTFVVWAFLMYYVYQMMSTQSLWLSNMQLRYGVRSINRQMHLMYQSGHEENYSFCMIFYYLNMLPEDDYMLLLSKIELLQIIILVGFLMTILQKLLILRLKKNSSVNCDELFLAIGVAASSGAYILKLNNGKVNTIGTDMCSWMVDFTPYYKQVLDFTFYQFFDNGEITSYPVIVGVNLALFTAYTLLLFKRTQRFQYILLMFEKMIADFALFLSTAGVLLLMVFITHRVLHEQLMKEQQSPGVTFKDLFDGFSGLLHEEKYLRPGHAMMMAFQFLARVFFMGFLASMFVLRFLKFSRSIEATKLKEVIALKNTISYDSQFGAITMTFFPVNILLLPFVIPILLMRSERLSALILQLQFGLLSLFYFFIGLVLAAVLTPLLYLKMVLNSAYACFRAKRRVNKLQELSSLALTGVAGLPLILLSFVADVFAFNAALFRDEKHLELKYQQASPIKSSDNYIQTKKFLRLFVTEHALRWKGVALTRNELKETKLAIFRIKDNFHSFFCRGDQSYEASMANIQLFNLSKAMAAKSSIPDRQGVQRNDLVDFDVMAALFADVTLFNFYEQLLTEHLNGHSSSIEAKVALGMPHLDYSPEQHHSCNLRWRALGDWFSFVAIRSVMRSFTDVDEKVKEFQEEIGFFAQKRQLLVLGKFQAEWFQDVAKDAEATLSTLEEHLCRFQAQRMTKKNKTRTRANSNLLARFATGSAWKSQLLPSGEEQDWQI